MLLGDGGDDVDTNVDPLLFTDAPSFTISDDDGWRVLVLVFFSLLNLPTTLELTKSLE